MFNSEKFTNDLKKNIRALLIVVSAITTITVVLTSIKMFIINQNLEEYNRHGEYIDEVTGSIAAKISYLFELEKLCNEFNRSTQEERQQSDYYSRFQGFFKEMVAARVRLEKSGPKLKSLLGGELVDEMRFFVQLDEDYSSNPKEYCSGKQSNWEQLKVKQGQFEEDAKLKLADKYKIKLY